MRDKVFCAIQNSRKALVFSGALLLLLIASPIYAQLVVTATAAPISGPAPLNVTFTSTVSGGTPTYTYLWNFGDTTTDTTASPSHTYNTAGTYAVTLTVTDSTLPTPLTRTINVGAIHVLLGVTATADPQCGTPPINVCFAGAAAGGTEPYSYKWNFGDGEPAYNTGEQFPCHGYMKVGNYNVTLNVTDALGNTGQTSLIIYVYNDVIPFTVGITADAELGLAPLKVNFFGSVSGPSNLTYTYSWDFGDGSATCVDVNPQHIFAIAGTYTVTLTVNGEDPLHLNPCVSSWTNSATIDVVVAEDPSIFITSPKTGSQVTGGNVSVESMALTSGTVLRVDYFIDGYYAGSSSVAPYRLTLDACGANGTYSITAILYDSKGHSATSPAVSITLSNPTLDGTNFVQKNPFRVKFYGTGFRIGAKLYVNGVEVPITKVLNSTTVIAKGGRALKALIPEGVPVLVTITNQDGSCANTITFQR
jgi:PKD repeat protein